MVIQIVYDAFLHGGGVDQGVLLVVIRVVVVPADRAAGIVPNAHGMAAVIEEHGLAPALAVGDRGLAGVIGPGELSALGIRAALFQQLLHTVGRVVVIRDLYGRSVDVRDLAEKVPAAFTDIRQCDDAAIRAGDRGKAAVRIVGEARGPSGRVGDPGQVVTAVIAESGLPAIPVRDLGQSAAAVGKRLCFPACDITDG